MAVSWVRAWLTDASERSTWGALMRTHHWDSPRTRGRSLRYVVDNPLRVGVDNPLRVGVDNPLRVGVDNPLRVGAEADGHRGWPLLGWASAASRLRQAALFLRITPRFQCPHSSAGRASDL